MARSALDCGAAAPALKGRTTDSYLGFGIPSSFRIRISSFPNIRVIRAIRGCLLCSHFVSIRPAAAGFVVSPKKS